MLRKFRLGRYRVAVLFVSLISLIHAFPVRATKLSTVPALTGTFSIRYGDGLPESGVDTLTLTGLVDSDGGWIPLSLGSARITPDVGYTLLAGKSVRVSGSWSEGNGEASSEPIFMVETLEVLAASDLPVPTPQVPIEAKPFVTILCRFADSPTVTPQPPSYYEGLMGIQKATAARNRGMDAYWREQSYGATTLQGSRVVGWYNLPQPRAYYVPGGPYPRWDRLTEDCTAAANADVFFPAFYGINLFFNGGVGCCGWGAPNQLLTLDGQTKTYGLVWQPPSLQNLTGVAHEMGHAFGDPHSDCGAWEKIGPDPCVRRDPAYGCIPVHDLAAYKDLYHGWIPTDRIYQSSEQSSRTVTIRLERLAVPGSTAGYLLAKIPIGGSTKHFYTLEARRFAGYDSGIAGEAVIIQDVDTSRSEPAHIVDANGSSNCQDEGAMWRVGERFVDSANDLYFEVLSADATSFEVAIGHCLHGPDAPDVPCPGSITLKSPQSGGMKARDSQ